MPMVVRCASPKDVPRIAEFNLRLAEETEKLHLNPVTVRNGVEAVLADPGKGRYLLAEKDRNVIGQLLLTYEWSDWRNAYFWWIQSVYIVPEERKNGVFKTLYESVKNEANATFGVCGLRLYVDHENRSAQRVYEKLGMISRRYGFYETEF